MKRIFSIVFLLSFVIWSCQDESSEVEVSKLVNEKGVGSLPEAGTLMPPELSSKTNTINTITVNFTAGLDSFTSYKIWISAAPSLPLQNQIIVSHVGSQSVLQSHTFTGLIPGVTYYVTIRGVNNPDESLDLSIDPIYLSYDAPSYDCGRHRSGWPNWNYNVEYDYNSAVYYNKHDFPDPSLVGVTFDIASYIDVYFQDDHSIKTHSLAYNYRVAWTYNGAKVGPWSSIYDGSDRTKYTSPDCGN